MRRSSDARGDIVRVSKNQSGTAAPYLSISSSDREMREGDKSSLQDCETNKTRACGSGMINLGDPGERVRGGSLWRV